MISTLSKGIISKHFREEVEDFFRTRDRDFDGFLSFEEFLGEESQIEKLFKKMDKDNDGKVSKQVSQQKNWEILTIYNNKLNIIHDILTHGVVFIGKTQIKNS